MSYGHMLLIEGFHDPTYKENNPLQPMANTLRRHIENSGPDDMIPSERSLRRRYGLSVLPCAQPCELERIGAFINTVARYAFVADPVRPRD